VYFFLITEKLNKVIVTGLGATVVILAQLFQDKTQSPQGVAFEYIHHNLDVLGFVVGMMILVGIVRESGFFEAVAIWLVKVVKGNPVWLLVSLCYLTLVMTALLSNIPTVLILTPIVLILIRELKLPLLPFLIGVVTFANIGGAMTPISDPTTYYEAKTVGLSFMEVVENSGIGVWLMSFSSIAYLLLLFRKDLAAVKVSAKDVASFKPASAIKDKKIMAIGLPLLFGSILLMILKETIAKTLGIQIDNASIVLFASFVAMLVFKRNPKEIFEKIVDWEIIFFFMGLFIVIGALEHNGVISALGLYLVEISKGSVPILLFLLTVGSGILSTFIDNVPYNITMVSAVQAMAKAGIAVYPLWWALNLGTSLGGAGSPIGAACNVVAVGIAEKEGKHVKFMKYLMVAFPLVVINALVAFGFLYVKYFVFNVAH
jgi:Na+/H+ antiporter NhaD/arsenite permease-like protein